MTRPKLGAVLRGENQADTAKQTSKPEAMVQLNVSVPASLRTAVRIRALQEGRDVGEVVRELLGDWLRSPRGQTDG